MVQTLLLSALALTSSAAAFSSHATGFVPSTSALTGVSRHHASAIRMGSTAAVAKKAELVDGVKTRLEASKLVFGLPSETLTVNDLNVVRQKLPEGVTMTCVKNTLMRRAVEGSSFDVLAPLLAEGSKYWIFVPEEEMRPAVELITKFIKDGKKTETNSLLGGAFDGTYLEGDKKVVEVSKLPTKQEAIQMIAIQIKKIPTKVATSINQVPTKVARAVKLATMPED